MSKVYINTYDGIEYEYLGIEDDTLKVHLKGPDGKLKTVKPSTFRVNFRLKGHKKKVVGKKAPEETNCIVGARELTRQGFIDKKLQEGQIKVYSFNELPIGVFEGEFRAKTVKVKTKSGVMIFDRSSGLQTNAKNPGFKARMEEYNGF